MSVILKIVDVKGMIIPFKGELTLLDSDVAKLYGVTTKVVNQAVKNNPDKFPNGFIIIPDKKDIINLRSKFLTTKISPKSRVAPKLFTERGLYMLATILKSPIATQTTLAIVNTFAEIRELKRTLLEMHDSDSDEFKKKGMIRIGEILADMIMPDLQTSETKTDLEFNFIIGKLKHSVTRQRINENGSIILREKVEFAKRMLAKGYPMEEAIELSGITERDLPLLEKWRKKSNPI